MFRSILSLISLLPLLVVAAQGLSSHHYRVLTEADKLLQAGNAEQAATSLLPLLADDDVPLTVYQYACRAATEANYPTRELNSCWQQAHHAYPAEKIPAVQLAELYLQAQRYQQALPLLQPWLKDNNIRYQYAYGLYHLGEHQQLLKLLVSEQQVPLNWLPLRAYSQLALEDWQGLSDESRRWLVRQPNQAQAWQFLSHAQLQLEQLQQAAQSLEMLSLLRPEQSRQPLLQLYAQLQASNLAAECLQDMVDLNCLQQGYLAGRYQQTLEASKLLTVGASDQDRLLLLQGRLHAALQQPQQARQQWHKVGQAPLPNTNAIELKRLRQSRERAKGQALLLIGQSYWLAQQWPEAQMIYRELERLPSFAGNAKALLNNLQYYVGDSEKKTR